MCVFVSPINVCPLRDKELKSGLGQVEHQQGPPPRSSICTMGGTHGVNPPRGGFLPSLNSDLPPGFKSSRRAWGGAEATRGPHGTHGEREKGETGGAQLLPPRAQGLLCSLRPPGWGEKPDKGWDLPQYFSFLGTSQGKLSLPKWP